MLCSILVFDVSIYFHPRRSDYVLRLWVWVRLHGNVESIAVLSTGAGDSSRRRDSIILAFRDAKISVLEFDDSVHGLRAR